jgi:chromosome segregation ATPase
MFASFNLLLMIGAGLMALGSGILFLQNRGLRLRLEDAGKIVYEQKQRFREDQGRRISALKQEIAKRNRLIQQLRQQLSQLKEQAKADQIQDRILTLNSEKDAMAQELVREEKALAEGPEIDENTLSKLSDELCKIRVEKSTCESLLGQYQKRYESILSWGNKMKKGSKDLEERTQHLESENAKLKNDLLQLKARQKAPFS